MGHTEARYGFQSIPQPVVLDMNGEGGGQSLLLRQLSFFLLLQGENDVLIFFSGGMNYFH